MSEREELLQLIDKLDILQRIRFMHTVDEILKEQRRKESEFSQPQRYWPGHELEVDVSYQQPITLERMQRALDTNLFDQADTAGSESGNREVLPDEQKCQSRSEAKRLIRYSINKAAKHAR